MQQVWLEGQLAPTITTGSSAFLGDAGVSWVNAAHTTPKSATITTAATPVLTVSWSRRTNGQFFVLGFAWPLWNSCPCAMC